MCEPAGRVSIGHRNTTLTKCVAMHVDLWIMTRETTSIELDHTDVEHDKHGYASGLQRVILMIRSSSPPLGLFQRQSRGVQNIYPKRLTPLFYQWTPVPPPFPLISGSAPCRPKLPEPYARKRHAPGHPVIKKHFPRYKSRVPGDDMHRQQVLLAGMRKSAVWRFPGPASQPPPSIGRRDLLVRRRLLQPCHELRFARSSLSGTVARVRHRLHVVCCLG